MLTPKCKIPLIVRQCGVNRRIICSKLRNFNSTTEPNDMHLHVSALDFKNDKNIVR